MAWPVALCLGTGMGTGRPSTLCQRRLPDGEGFPPRRGKVRPPAGQLAAVILGEALEWYSCCMARRWRVLVFCWHLGGLVVVTDALRTLDGKWPADIASSRFPPLLWTRQRCCIRAFPDCSYTVVTVVVYVVSEFSALRMDFRNSWLDVWPLGVTLPSVCIAMSNHSKLCELQSNKPIWM